MARALLDSLSLGGTPLPLNSSSETEASYSLNLRK